VGSCGDGSSEASGAAMGAVVGSKVRRMGQREESGPVRRVGLVGAGLAGVRLGRRWEEG